MNPFSFAPPSYLPYSRFQPSVAPQPVAPQPVAPQPAEVGLLLRNPDGRYDVQWSPTPSIPMPSAQYSPVPILIPPVPAPRYDAYTGQPLYHPAPPQARFDAFTGMPLAPAASFSQQPAPASAEATPTRTRPPGLPRAAASLHARPSAQRQRARSRLREQLLAEENTNTLTESSIDNDMTESAATSPAALAEARLSSEAETSSDDTAQPVRSSRPLAQASSAKGANREADMPIAPGTSAASIAMSSLPTREPSTNADTSETEAVSSDEGSPDEGSRPPNRINRRRTPSPFADEASSDEEQWQVDHHSRAFGAANQIPSVLTVAATRLAQQSPAVELTTPPNIKAPSITGSRVDDAIVSTKDLHQTTAGTSVAASSDDAQSDESEDDEQQSHPSKLKAKSDAAEEARRSFSSVNDAASQSLEPDSQFGMSELESPPILSPEAPLSIPQVARRSVTVSSDDDSSMTAIPRKITAAEHTRDTSAQPASPLTAADPAVPLQDHTETDERPESSDGAPSGTALGNNDADTITSRLRSRTASPGHLRSKDKAAIRAEGVEVSASQAAGKKAGAGKRSAKAKPEAAKPISTRMNGLKRPQKARPSMSNIEKRLNEGTLPPLAVTQSQSKAASRSRRSAQNNDTSAQQTASESSDDSDD